MKINHIKVNSPFRYIWLKYIVDHDLNTHCASSLIGEYSKRISAKTVEGYNLTLDEHPHRVMYLCGVAYPFVWGNNFHLAFRYKKGEILRYSDNGIEVEIQNAERIYFSEKDIDTTHKKAKFKSYNTCRNWQFANWLAKNQERLELIQ